MANLTTVPASVLASANSTGFIRATAAATIAQGDVLAKDANGALILADANGSALEKVVVGIACNAGSATQPVDYVTEDPDFTPGDAALVEGTVYVLSATPGKIAPAADLASGHAATVLGVGKATAKLNLKLVAGGTKA